MSNICWLSKEEYDEWDAFVNRHPRGLIYHLSDWQRTLEKTFKHIRGHFLVLRDSESNIQAGLPLYTVRSWLLGNRLVSVPFATMCDPLILEKDEIDLLWPVIKKFSVDQNCKRIEIRIRHTNQDCLNGILSPGMLYKHHYLPLDKTTYELFNSFNKSNICRAINKAKKENIIVEEKHDEQSLRIFHSFLVSTRRKHSLPPMPFAFFQKMYHTLKPDHFALYLATQDGQPVGGIMISKFKSLWTSEYSGDADGSSRGVSPLIYWDIIQRAKDSGATYFSFGRTSLNNTGLLIHKRRWATIEEDLTDFVSPPNMASVQDQGVSKFGGRAIRSIMSHSPSIIQKLIGDFSYRHLG